MRNVWALASLLAATSAAGCEGRVAIPVAGTPEAAMPAASAGDGCSHLGQFVSAGGTAGFNTLMNPGFTTSLLAAGHVRLYEHGVAVAAAIASSPRGHSYSILNAIENVFAGTGPGEAELGLAGANYFTLPAAAYHGYYRYQYVLSGLRPNAANVNVPYEPAPAIRFTPANVRAWKSFVQAGRSVGIASMAPVVAPNLAWQPRNPIFPPARSAYYDIASDFYKLSRFEAIYGGAIAFDTPSDFFLSGGSGPGYQDFVVGAIRWGNARGLRTTVLVSPLNRRTFSEDTKRFVEFLARRNAVPSEWSVDDYENTEPDDAAAMGPDTMANTTTAVALWLASHAPVSVHGVTCRSGSLQASRLGGK